jgi:hypothetical protein
MRSINGRCWSTAAALFVAVVSFLPLPAAAATPCVGDCNNDGAVTVDELLETVNIALGAAPVTMCPEADFNHDGTVTIDEMLMAVNAALSGCTPAPTGCTSSTTPFASTFDGIQKVIFENRGCTSANCHSGSTPQGGLNLTAGMSYQNLVQVPSTESSFNRVEPGDASRSYLWLKVADSTNPSALPTGVQIAGSPMPVGLPAISANELEALRLWIFTGAPQTGTVDGTQTLLNACLPPAEPIVITPLDPPAAGTGVQFVLPQWPLEANSEHEICFATYYDITSQVPQQYQDPSGTLFRFSSEEVREDPQSHHLILNRYIGSAADIHDPSFGSWTCRNNSATEGQPCEPTDLTACGTGGVCTSAIQQSFACIGFGPGSAPQNFYAIGGSQRAQFTDQYAPGVFAQIPMKGILYWNSHAFNLTNTDTTMHGRINYYFSNSDQYPVQSIFDTSKIFAMSAKPYTTQTVCNNFVLPQGARLFELSSHTHKHGKHFTVCAPNQPASAMGSGSGECSGPLLYESFIYNDPVSQKFDPPLAFDSPDDAQRTLQYCSFYNNGVAADGSPDPTLVERASLIPASAVDTFGGCSPTACAAGKIGTACNGSGDDRACDSTPTANDGLCDACKLTGGESTQNDMFILIGSYYLDPTVAGQAGSSPALAVDAKGRSLSTEVVLPPQMSCAASHSHAAHVAMLHAAQAAGQGGQ